MGFKGLRSQAFLYVDVNNVDVSLATQDVHVLVVHPTTVLTGSASDQVFTHSQSNAPRKAQNIAERSLP